MKSPATVERYNKRLGLVLFAMYLVIYGGFVALVAYDYKKTAMPMFGGLNLAIVCGFGLIASAFGLALVYMFMARSMPSAAAAAR